MEKKYLFGPGITDHIPDQGFGQMGMGDYHKRIQAYCRMFIEDVTEDELHRLFVSDGGIDKAALCKQECISPASGTSGAPSEDAAKKRAKKQAQPRRRTPAPKPPAEEMPPKELWDPPPPPPTPAPRKAAPPPPPPAPRKEPRKADAKKIEPAREAGALSNVEQAVALLPRLSPLQLRWLGEAVISELAKRATDADAVGRTEL